MWQPHPSRYRKPVKTPHPSLLLFPAHCSRLEAVQRTPPPHQPSSREPPISAQTGEASNASRAVYACLCLPCALLILPPLVLPRSHSVVVGSTYAFTKYVSWRTEDTHRRPSMIQVETCTRMTVIHPTSHALLCPARQLPTWAGRPVSRKSSSLPRKKKQRQRHFVLDGGSIDVDFDS